MSKAAPDGSGWGALAGPTCPGEATGHVLDRNGEDYQGEYCRPHGAELVAQGYRWRTIG